ncbi:MAG TPA: c-type cytochrome [Usitatibacter sp.]|nr:c-type cytochrome [Usitatibacter sp.]
MKALAILAGAGVAAAGLAAGAAGDAARGEEIYSRCAACHSLAQDRAGPRHCGVLGRKAGSVRGFEYSPAMKRSGITWDARSLDRFLADPMRAIPGTSMGYDGVKDARERADLIAFLARASRSAECAKPYN